MKALTPASFRLATVLVVSAVIAILGCGSGSSSPPAPVDVDSDLPLPLAAGIAPTPPMGWNTWNTFSCNISEKLIQQTADAMVATGMQAAGYQYINIDDCWSTKDATGVRADGEALVPDPAKFPNGIGPVADYVHADGLKLGIYADRGTLTCGGFPGSEGHEVQDATTFAGWGVDYVKYDNCPPSPTPSAAEQESEYQAMGAALAASGRAIVYSLCAWNFYEWGVSLGNLWRTTTDIKPTWDSVVANLQTNQAFAAYAGPNGWNDADMLEIGNFTTPDQETPDILTQYQAHFSLWAIMAAPLILGNDLRGSQMSAAVRAILTNPEIIALDQDAFGYQGVQVWTDGGDLSVWAKPLNASGARGVVMLNAGAAPADVTFDLSQIGLRDGSATARDLWAQADLGSFKQTFTRTVPATGVVALRVNGVEPLRPSGTQVYLSDLEWTYASNGLGPIEKDESNGASDPGDGTPLSLRGTGFTKGLGVAGPSVAVFRLAQSCSTFSAQVGVDDATKGGGSVVFQVWADGTKLFDSGVVTGMSAAMPVNVDVTGVRRLKLLVTNGGDGASLDRADWADAQLGNCM